MKQVAIADSGIGNIASLLAAFRKIGAAASMTRDPEAILSSEFVLLPGVGAFGQAMRAINAHGIGEALVSRIRSGKPTLGICLGMQLAFADSEETPGEKGLGVFGTPVTKFAKGLRVPQIGWNKVEADPRCRILESGWAYFANSYKVEACPREWLPAVTRYSEPFVSGMEQGDSAFCQFHPELSGPYGLGILGRWLGFGRPAFVPGSSLAAAGVS